MSWLKFLFALNKILSAVRVFFIALRARMQGREEQAEAQRKADEEAIARADAAAAAVTDDDPDELRRDENNRDKQGGVSGVS